MKAKMAHSAWFVAEGAACIVRAGEDAGLTSIRNCLSMPLDTSVSLQCLPSCMAHILRKDQYAVSLMKFANLA